MFTSGGLGLGLKTLVLFTSLVLLLRDAIGERAMC